jgi:hypothetical protein
LKPVATEWLQIELSSHFLEIGPLVCNLNNGIEHLVGKKGDWYFRSRKSKQRTAFDISDQGKRAGNRDEQEHFWLVRRSLPTIVNKNRRMGRKD